MQSVIGRIIINNTHTVVVIILDVFDFSNLKRVLSSNQFSVHHERCIIMI